ncbi:MAG: hypothetical protein J5779_02345 [Clostridia bacterium]|nr:hypothetical protein [Clostridia bacterium]
MSSIYNTKYVVYRDAKFYDNAKMTDLLKSAREDLLADEFDILDPVNIDILKMCKDYFERKWYWTTKGIDQEIYLDFQDAYDSYLNAIKIVANIAIKRVNTDEYRAKVDAQMSRIEKINEINKAARENYEMFKLPSEEAFRKE